MIFELETWSTKPTWAKYESSADQWIPELAGEWDPGGDEGVIGQWASRTDHLNGKLIGKPFRPKGQGGHPAVDESVFKFLKSKRLIALPHLDVDIDLATPVQLQSSSDEFVVARYMSYGASQYEQRSIEVAESARLH